VLILAVSKNKTVVADNNDVIEAKNDEDVTEEIPEEDEVETEDVESEEAETESEAITEEGDISEEEESVAEDGTQPQNRSSSSVEKNDGTEKTQVQATEKQTEKATQPTTKAATQSKESNDAPSGDYEEDTIWFGADKSSGYNCYGNIYVEGSADATPIMDVDNLYPKQVNSIEIKSGVSERIYAENTSQGLKIITSGGSLIVPASGNREHYPYESLSPNVHSYTMVFKDFNHDGVKEIFVSDLACCSSGDKKLIALFMTGSFVTFNGNMKPVLCSGDELFMMCGADIMTIKDNSVLTQNTYGTQYVSYKLDGNTVVKFEGSE
jgi:hypothetical protein